MKTQEEIEQLAEQDFNDRQDCGHYELADLKSIDYYYDGFTNGYTQCQEELGQKVGHNVQAERMYTEEDIRQAINVGINAEAGNYPKGWSFKLGISLEDYFINSLNKQD
jgi:hypothetical protein